MPAVAVMAGVPLIAGAVLRLRDELASAVLVIDVTVKNTSKIAKIFLGSGIDNLYKTVWASVHIGSARVRWHAGNVRFAARFLKLSRRRDVSDQQHQMEPDGARQKLETNCRLGICLKALTCACGHTNRGFMLSNAD